MKWKNGLAFTFDYTALYQGASENAGAEPDRGFDLGVGTAWAVDPAKNCIASWWVKDHEIICNLLLQKRDWECVPVSSASSCAVLAPSSNKSVKASSSAAKSALPSH